MEDKLTKFEEMEYHTESDVPFVAPTLLAVGTYGDYSYVIASEDGAYPRAFVRLPEYHPYRYFEEFHHDYMYGVDCHGGLTYSDYDGTCGFPNDEYIPSGTWIGWDYGGYKDFNGHTPIIKIFAGFERKKWTVDEIAEECKDVIRQLMEISNERG